MSKAIHVCKHWWCCCPGWLQWFVVFFVANIAGDLISFPFVHSFWNLVNFEGWFFDD